MRLPMEPYRPTVVERVPFPPRDVREAALHRADYNVFRLPSDVITVDLLSDSGTGALSTDQLASAMRGDEAYAGAHSFERFRSVVQDITGFPEVIPVHQGRAAERLVFSTLLEQGTIAVSNGHFDTTAANVALAGGHAIDLPRPRQPGQTPTFGGDLDIDALSTLLDSPDGARVRCVVLTLPDNAGGGQPVSLRNVQQTRAVCDHYGIPLWLDASRWAENAYLITTRDPDCAHLSPREAAAEVFRLAHGCWASLKKDGLGHIGGLIALHDPTLARRLRDLLILTEGYETYGGLSGAALEMLAVGLQEVTDPEYLRYRAEAATWLADELEHYGFPIIRPAGCHGVYIDAAAMLPHIPPRQLPGQAMVCQFYLEGAVRCVELGTLAFGHPDSDGAGEIPATRELVRLALPRRKIPGSHLEWVAETASAVAARADRLRGYRITDQPPTLRHFTAHLEPLPQQPLAHTTGEGATGAGRPR